MNNQSLIMKNHGKTFFWATWFLEKTYSNRLYAIYAFCRRIDDLVDETKENSTRRKKLNEVIDAWDNKQYHEVISEFSNISKNYLPRNIIIKEFLKGQTSDLNHKQPKNISELLIYCYQVAGIVGLMVCDSMGIKEKRLKYHAIDLGIAMQLTNICRDIREDAEKKRIYLPKNMVRGITINKITNPTKEQCKDINKARKKLLDLADEYYQSGYCGIDYLPKKTARAIRVAAKLYQGIGVKMIRNKTSYSDERTYLSKIEKTIISLKTIFFSTNSQKCKRHNKSLHSEIKNFPDANQ